MVLLTPGALPRTAGEAANSPRVAVISPDSSGGRELSRTQSDAANSVAAAGLEEQVSNRLLPTILPECSSAQDHGSNCPLPWASSLPPRWLLSLALWRRRGGRPRSPLLSCNTWAILDNRLRQKTHQRRPTLIDAEIHMAEILSLEFGTEWVFVFCIMVVLGKSRSRSPPLVARLRLRRRAVGSRLYFL